MVVEYKAGRIYKIISSQGTECYVGSTFDELRFRFQKHKKNYRSWKQGHTYESYIASFDLFDKYGIENCKMVLVKEYSVCDRSHLRAYEALWVRKLKSINKVSPLHIGNKMAKRARYQVKREEILQKAKEYSENKKEAIKERMKKYRTKNSEIIKQKKTVVEICECGTPVSHDGFSVHRKTQKHIRLLADLEAGIIRDQKTNKIMCECGTMSDKAHLPRHKLTQKHQKLMAEKSSPEAPDLSSKHPPL